LPSRQPWVDVTSAMDERPRERSVVLRVVPTGPGADQTRSDADPFADVAI
jgi:hypothetical protein